MAQTKIKAGLFEGIIGNGTDGYFLMSNGDGTMAWSSVVINPTITSIAYPGSATAADPSGGETITLTGTGFKTGATVTIGGTAAPAVSYVSATQITFTTPAKAAGDYDIVVTNTDTGSATYINGISYNGIPSWTTAAGSLGTFASDTTISTITLQATEPDAGTITFSITNGALPTGLSLTGANIDGTTTLETADTLYTFTVTATDDESQATPRTFTITVTKQFIGTENFTINTYTGNGSTQSIEGKIGTAADFNGSSSKIDLGNSAVFSSTNTGELSISLWINTTDSDAGYILAKGNDSQVKYEHNLYLNTNGTLRGQMYNSSAGIAATVTTTATVNDGNWHHVVLVIDNGTSLKIYVDNGTPVTSTGWSGTVIYQSTVPFLLGAFEGVSASSSKLLGKLDQVRIFNKALSSSEVTTLYGENNTSSTKSTTDIFDDSSGIALYEFEEGAIDTGGTYNGTPTNVGFVGTSFQPDFVWIKRRSSTQEHGLYDSVRGATKQLYSDLTNGEVTATNSLTSFDSNGFSIGNSGLINLSGQTHVAWCWKAGGAAVSNTDGTITSQVSANQDAGFSIVKYTGNGTTNQTIGHGLSSSPTLIITKCLNDGTKWWGVNSTLLTTNALLRLDSTSAELADSGNYITMGNSSTFTVQDGSIINGSLNYIAYCFHSVDSYQKVGSYTGTNSSQSITGLGFAPRFVMVKSAAGGTGPWVIHDKVRFPTNPSSGHLRANTSGAEDTGVGEQINFDSDGFTINYNACGNINCSGVTFIYLAIA